MTEKLNELIAEYLKWLIENNPTFSSYLGFREYDHLMEDYSKEAIEGKIKQLKEYRRRLEAIAFTEELDYLLLKRQLETSLYSLDNRKDWQKSPAIYLELPLAFINKITEREGDNLSKETMEKILEKLDKTPVLLAQGKENLTTPPKIATEMAIKQAELAAYFFQKMFNQIKEKEPSLERFASEVAEHVLPAINNYQTYLTEELVPCSTGDFAEGEEGFNWLLKNDYMLDFSADLVLQIGKELHAKTLQEINNLAERIDPAKNWQEIYCQMQQDTPKAGELRSIYEETIQKIKTFLQEKKIAAIPPEESFSVQDTPVFLREIIPIVAYTLSNPIEKVKNGIFNLTPIDEKLPSELQKEILKEHNFHTIPVLSLHETYPGHHLHLVYNFLQPSLLRSLTLCNLTLEGWALYCEQMMKEEGFLQDPLVELAQLRMQLWRTARVIVDVSLHTKGMTIEEAVQFMQQEGGMSSKCAEAEVKRYALMPTQPLSYIIGKREVLALREEYKKLKGKEYSLYDFHNKFLECGTLPIKLTRQKMLSE